MSRVLCLLLVAATAAAAGPLPASYTALDAKKTMWVSPAMSLAQADQEWHALVDKPGLVPLIVDNKPEPDPPDADPPPPAKPLALATARARLLASRRARIASYDSILAAHPGDVSAADRRAYRTQWTTWEKALASATITADDRRQAAQIVADTADGNDSDGKPKQFYVLVNQGSVDSVVAQIRARDDEDMGPEFAPVLAAWKKRYGARPYAWDGYQWWLDVPRPPTRLGELRALAREFALACPFDRAADGEIAMGESPGALMARLAERRWVCFWFEE